MLHPLRTLRCTAGMQGTVSKGQRCSARRCITTTVQGPWNYVAGKRCAPTHSAGRTVQVCEPATGALLCTVPVSGAEDVDEAVHAARNAQETWSKLSGRERGQMLVRAAAVMREHLEDIAHLEVRDSGKPLWEARVDISSCADTFEYYGGLAPTITGQYVPLAGGSFAMVSREPLGVVGGIGSWNFPMQMAAWKAAPALACGNTLVYKPSQFTPVTAVTLGEVLTEAGVMPGVYNVVQGEGDTGRLLSEHRLVSKLSFTGSLSTGKKVMAAAATGIKAVTLELGGKSPLLVFADADLTNAVKGAMLANFLSQGQVCSNGTRVFVHRSILPQFTEQLVAATLRLKVGDPFADGTTVGATIHEQHARAVLGYVERAVQQGCTLLCGGKRQQLTGHLSGGWYLQPAVLADCTDSMEVVREEVFGAVLALLSFDSEDEVIRRANDTDFGLAGAVFTKDLQRGHRVSAALHCGTVWLNTYNAYPPEVPFGGCRLSGLGRENGKEVLHAYTQTKTTYVEAGDVDAGPLY